MVRLQIGLKHILGIIQNLIVLLDSDLHNIFPNEAYIFSYIYYMCKLQKIMEKSTFDIQIFLENRKYMSYNYDCHCFKCSYVNYGDIYQSLLELKASISRYCLEIESVRKNEVNGNDKMYLNRLYKFSIDLECYIDRFFYCWTVSTL